MQICILIRNWPGAVLETRKFSRSLKLPPPSSEVRLLSWGEGKGERGGEGRREKGSGGGGRRGEDRKGEDNGEGRIGEGRIMEKRMI